MSKKYIGITLSLIAMVSLLHALQEEDYASKEYETTSARAWADSLASDLRINLLFGSSNIAYSLDCAHLDELCTNENYVWYNLGQKGMRGIELLDYVYGFLKKSNNPDLFNGIYIEAAPDDLNNWKMNWRNADIMPISSIIDQTVEAMDKSVKFSTIWQKIEEGIKGLLMSSVVPLHDCLYPSKSRSKKSTKGFYAPGAHGLKWQPNDFARAQLQAYQKNQYDWEIFLRNEDDENFEQAQNAYFSYDRLQDIADFCHSEGIELHMVFISTENTIYLYDELEKITQNQPIVLGLSGEIRPFSTPEFMQDVRHLNAKGVDLVTQEFAYSVIHSKK